MFGSRLFPVASSLAILLAAAVIAAGEAPGAKVDFARQIQPILAQNCYKCHGAEKHKADLRLDLKANALEGGASGKAIVPGRSADSLIIKHVTGVEDHRRMPPEPADPLNPEQIGLLKAWIDQGADWPDVGAGGRDPRLDHWAYQAPVRREEPKVSHPEWCRNPIDHFILARLEKEGFVSAGNRSGVKPVSEEVGNAHPTGPSSEADRETLIRRVTLDLTGLPPTLGEIDAFVKDASADAYEKIVDRLLASPHYGEHWARWWLDAARYADTNGYEKDRPRSMWRYRDYVIDAFNTDMPFDRFTIEQMAGDMLPNASEAQKIATAFHRNTMINEEGGIDTEEYRFRSIVDRVQTTGTVFLGMTIQCCQCHNHKYDPISQREYYQFFSLLNNQDEPMLETPTAAERSARARIESQIAAIEATYEEQYPLPYDQLAWTVLEPVEATVTGGAMLRKMDDRSLLAYAAAPDTDTYTVSAVTDARRMAAVRLEVLTDSSLPKTGPGRAENGNFVLSSLRMTTSAKDKSAEAKSLSLVNASADYSQSGFSVGGAIDDDPKTGWAVGLGPNEAMQGHTATFELKDPLEGEGGSRLTFTLGQQFGARHTIGRFRLLVGSLPGPDARPPASAGGSDTPVAGAAAAKRRAARAAGVKRPVASATGSDGGRDAAHGGPALQDRVAAMREAHLRADQAAWEALAAPEVADWRVLRPVRFDSEKKCTMTRLEDESILVTGNRPTRDTYTVDYETDLTDITAIRLEAIPDARLPFHGPGRGSAVADGNFMLNEIVAAVTPLDAQPQMAVPVKFKSASADYYGEIFGNKHKPEYAIDNNLDSGWSVAGAIGKKHWAVFEFAEPVGCRQGTKLSIRLVQSFIDQHTLGRFRIAATRKTGGVRASQVLPEIESVLAMPREWWNALQTEQVEKYYLATTPQLQAQHDRVAALRASEPAVTTTLVLEERTQDPRTTHIHIRGEWNQEGEAVTPGVPSMLPPLPPLTPPSQGGAGGVANRLTLARWMVDGQNPLTARVVVNRVWREYFGRGIVETVEDFGMRAEKPSHPELLDWLATEFVRGKWSLKAMHRLIVTSATYRQSSVVTPSLQEKDPYNVLLARGPRFRVTGEQIRDIALAVSGLLNDRIGGPSVYPPQPEGVTGLAYGGAPWTTSSGEDRYRRGLYTFWKRANPYPAIVVFDAPARDQCTVKRLRSNTPLQALTLLNDPVYVEAAQGLARRILSQGPAGVGEKIAFAFRLCTGRAPSTAEVERLTGLLKQELARFSTGKADAATVALPDPKAAPGDVDVKQLAAWMMMSNVLLNLDETITKG